MEITIYTTVEKFIKWCLHRDGGLQVKDGVLFAESVSNRRVSMRVLEKGQVKHYCDHIDSMDHFHKENVGAAHSMLGRVDIDAINRAVGSSGIKVVASPVGGINYELENPPYGMLEEVWCAMWRDATLRMCTHLGINHEQKVDVVLTGYEESTAFFNSTLSALVIPS